MCSAAVESFAVISNLTVTTFLMINYSRVGFFSSEHLKKKKVHLDLSLHLDLEITFGL